MSARPAPLASMTGFGRATARGRGVTVAVELAAVNHRFFKIQFRLPELLTSLRPRLETAIRRRILRGSLTCTVLLDRPAPSARAFFRPELAHQVLRELTQFAKAAGLSPPRDVTAFLSLPGLIHTDVETRPLTADEEALVLRATDRALTRLVQDRRREGRALARDLRERHRRLRHHLRALRREAPAAVAAARRRLEERVRGLLAGASRDLREALVGEVLLLAERGDVAEELTRLESHLAHLEGLLRKGGECGKALEFLLQEIHREIHTLGTKVPAPRVSPHVLAMKAEVEKIREQAQNLE